MTYNIYRDSFTKKNGQLIHLEDRRGFFKIIQSNAMIFWTCPMSMYIVHCTIVQLVSDRQESVADTVSVSGQ